MELDGGSQSRFFQVVDRGEATFEKLRFVRVRCTPRDEAAMWGTSFSPGLRQTASHAPQRRHGRAALSLPLCLLALAFTPPPQCGEAPHRRKAMGAPSATC